MINPRTGKGVSLLNMFQGEFDGSLEIIMDSKINKQNSLSLEELAEKEADGYMLREDREWEWIKESFISGHASRQAEVDGLREALEFYARGRHFEYCGLDDYEPEPASGEPENWLCGGRNGSEFQYEDGWVAREALEKSRQQDAMEKQQQGVDMGVSDE